MTDQFDWHPVDLPRGPLALLPTCALSTEADLLALEPRLPLQLHLRALCGDTKTGTSPVSKQVVETALDDVQGLLTLCDLDPLTEPPYPITRTFARDLVSWRIAHYDRPGGRAVYVTEQGLEYAAQNQWLPLYDDLLDSEAREAFHRTCRWQWGEDRVRVDAEAGVTFVRLAHTLV